MKHTHPKFFRVAIFGSARIDQKDPTYKKVYHLAERLGKANIDVITGGGPGLMEAAASGHKSIKGKGKSIGLNIRLPNEKANRHLDIKEEFDRFSRRLDHFMALSNVVVVTPGGVGTMLELFYTWQLVQVAQICNTPIILYGEMWKGLINWIKREPLKKKLLDKEDLDHLFYATDVKQVMKIVEETHKLWETDENFCLNYEKYKI